MWRKERVIIMAIPAYYSLLQRGSSGPDVALVQTWLNGVRDACTWYGELKTDGKFGISTENAVKEFQLKNKMNVDGKVGANTWNVLYTRYTAKHGLHVFELKSLNILSFHCFPAQRLFRRHGASGAAEAQFTG